MNLILDDAKPGGFMLSNTSKGPYLLKLITSQYYNSVNVILFLFTKLYQEIIALQLQAQGSNK